MHRKKHILLIVLSLFLGFFAYALGKSTSPIFSDEQGQSSTCEVVLAHFNQDVLDGQIDTAQLVDIVRTLQRQHQLPAYFVTKQKARQLGWTPGMAFNRIPALQGKSIGGDRFGNYEQRLPAGDWKEADLDYHGEKRNAKRIVFSRQGDQYVTINHYQQFHKVPACQ